MTTNPRSARSILMYLLIGLAAGLLSGLFGVGGGTVIVPMLALLARFEPRLAAGTSLAAIVPTAAVGVISYAVHGAVAWIPALILAAAAVVGAQFGSWLLARLPVNVVRWAFIAFLAVVVVALFFVFPSREAHIELTALSILGLIATGLVTGILSGLLGVGGGVIVVPALILGFGASDLVAKGTSLLMMIPTAISGTIANIRRGNVDLVAAGCVGVAACTTTAAGAWLATLLNPVAANILFAAFIVFIAAQMAVRALRAGRAQRA